MSSNLLSNLLSVCTTWFLDFSTEMSENYLHFQKVFAIRKNMSARIWILVYFLFVCFLSRCTFMVLLNPLGYNFSVNTLVSKILYVFKFFEPFYK